MVRLRFVVVVEKMKYTCVQILSSCIVQFASGRSEEVVVVMETLFYKVQDFSSEELVV